MKGYRVKTGSDKIEEFEMAKWSTNSVDFLVSTVNQEARQCGGWEWVQTKDEAVRHVRKHLVKQIEDADEVASGAYWALEELDRRYGKAEPEEVAEEPSPE